MTSGEIVAGFISIGNVSDLLPDPYFAIAEILILAMGLVMVMLTIVIDRQKRPDLLGDTALILTFTWDSGAACAANTRRPAIESSLEEPGKDGRHHTPRSDYLRIWPFPGSISESPLRDSNRGLIHEYHRAAA